MDLKVHFLKLRELAAEIEDKDLYVVSKATADGGKAGVMTLVPKLAACELIVLDKARRATEDEILEYELKQAEEREAAAQREAASRVQVQVITTPGKR